MISTELISDEHLNSYSCLCVCEFREKFYFTLIIQKNVRNLKKMLNFEFLLNFEINH